MVECITVIDPHKSFAPRGKHDVVQSGAKRDHMTFRVRFIVLSLEILVVVRHSAAQDVVPRTSCVMPCDNCAQLLSIVQVLPLLELFKQALVFRVVCNER